MATASDPKAPLGEGLFSGSCACGAITFVCTTTPKSVTNCYCNTCRKASGASHQTYANIPQESVNYHERGTGLARPSSTGRDNGSRIDLNLSDVAMRSYCSYCHTPLSMQYRKQPDRLHICVGSVDADSVAGDDLRRALMATQNIFMSQKPVWVKVDDGLPAFDRFDGDFEDLIEGRSESTPGKLDSRAGKDVKLSCHRMHDASSQAPTL
nr:hypothetical protein B0A51_12755 [Rachicladosporium sp. CCFEE 5018]